MNKKTSLNITLNYDVLNGVKNTKTWDDEEWLNVIPLNQVKELFNLYEKGAYENIKDENIIKKSLLKQAAVFINNMLYYLKTPPYQNIFDFREFNFAGLIEPGENYRNLPRKRQVEIFTKYLEARLKETYNFIDNYAPGDWNYHEVNEVIQNIKIYTRPIDFSAFFMKQMLYYLKTNPEQDIFDFSGFNQTKNYVEHLETRLNEIAAVIGDKDSYNFEKTSQDSFITPDLKGINPIILSNACYKITENLKQFSKFSKKKDWILATELHLRKPNNEFGTLNDKPLIYAISNEIEYEINKLLQEFKNNNQDFYQVLNKELYQNTPFDETKYQFEFLNEEFIYPFLIKNIFIELNLPINNQTQARLVETSEQLTYQLRALSLDNNSQINKQIISKAKQKVKQIIKDYALDKIMPNVINENALVYGLGSNIMLPYITKYSSDPDKIKNYTLVNNSFFTMFNLDASNNSEFNYFSFPFSREKINEIDPYIKKSFIDVLKNEVKQCSNKTSLIGFAYYDSYDGVNYTSEIMKLDKDKLQTMITTLDEKIAYWTDYIETEQEAIVPWRQQILTSLIQTKNGLENALTQLNKTKTRQK